MSEADRARQRWQSLGAFAIYLAIAIVLLDRGLLGHPGYYIGRDTDPPQTMWFFNWWRYSIAHRLNPFFTDLVWAPLGINLAWTTLVPLPAFVSMPLQATVGEPATYNVIITLAPPLAAFSAFLLCRRVTGAFWPSVVGGYLFGFSSYMLGEVLAHLDLVSVFPVPLIALVALKRVQGEISARRFAILLGALLTIQFLCFPEIFATVTIVGGFALLVAFLLFDHEVRMRLLGLIVPTIAGYLIATAILSPYLFCLLAKGFPHAPIWRPESYSADLLAFVVPTEMHMLGRARIATNLCRLFVRDIFENGAYLGLAIIIFVEVFRRRFWREPIGKFLMIMFVTLLVAALGPVLQIAGKQGIYMPWALVGRLPVLSIALPVRFMMYAFLVIALMVAMWLAAASAQPLTKFAVAAIIVASIAPNPRASFWVSPLDIPAFFTEGSYAKELEPREIILPLPWGNLGNSMYWQMLSGMYFRMAGGWTGISPFEFNRMPVNNYFYGGIDLPEAGDQLKAYIARFGVQAIIADPNEANFESFQQTLSSLGVAGQNEKGVWLYKIPHDSFVDYANLAPAQVEARAIALRFDTILEAAAKYVDEGHDLSKLSALELKRLDFLPHDWLVNPDPSAYFDWQIGAATGSGVGVIVVGSYDGVRPLIERYQSIASTIDYPGPKRWTPDSHPRGDIIAPMLVIFDRAHLSAAAKAIHDSPPPERTTSFLAGVRSGLGTSSP
jgi:hypothetical protein